LEITTGTARQWPRSCRKERPVSRRRILVQLDGDEQPSVFDSVVAVDADADVLLRHGGVKPDQVRDLVYGAMFTRGPEDLKNTAVFIGGSDVAAGEELLRRVTGCFFGPMRVSVLLDANGANTTAAAAVRVAARHVNLRDATALVLAATGPVGQRAVRLLAGEGARVRVASRNRSRAEEACEAIRRRVPDAQLTAVETASEHGLAAAVDGATVIIAAGAPAIQLLPAGLRVSDQSLKAAIDLNAVPPSGIEGVDVMDRGQERDGAACYGAIGVGALKMKIHKAAVRKLFTANHLVLDAEEVFALGKEVT
jgi:methylenetetrahydrofolate/methylenetetrahydromethanopterin dehydrogenase (NADP+)